MSLSKNRERMKGSKRVVNACGCWNVRSLVEDEGGLEMAGKGRR